MSQSNDVTEEVIGVPPANPDEAAAFWADAMGFDTARQWCTAVAVADSGGGMTLLVAKEVVTLNVPGDPKPQFSRNVTSLVMPAATAIGLRDALITTYPLDETTDG